MMDAAPPLPNASHQLEASKELAVHYYDPSKYAVTKVRDRNPCVAVAGDDRVWKFPTIVF